MRKQNMNEQTSKTYLTTPITLLISALWLFFILIVSGTLLEKVIYKSLWSSTAYCVAHTILEPLYFIAGLAVLIIFVYLFRQKGLGGSYLTGDGTGAVCSLPFKKRIKIMLGSLAIWFLISIFNAAAYERFDADGICSRFLFFEKDYTWDEVTTYNVKAGFDNTLEFSLITSDGRKHAVTGGFVMTIYEEVPDHMPDYDYTDYIMDVVTLLHDRGIDPDIDWEKAENGMMQYWAEYTEELRKYSECK